MSITRVIGLINEDMTRRKLIIIGLGLLCFTNLKSQEVESPSETTKLDSACLTNNSLYREYYKQKNYEDALSSWRWTFMNCPKINRNVYKNGPIIIKMKMKKKKEDKLLYLDTLMMIYDQRIKYFGNEDYVLGKKGTDLLLYDKSKYKEAYLMLKRSIDNIKNNAEANPLVSYFKSAVYMEQNGELSVQEVVGVFGQTSEIIEYNLLENIKKAKQYMQAFEKIKKLFEPYSNCDDLIALYADKFDSETNDTNLLKRITSLLSENKCEDAKLYYDASMRLYKLIPSSTSAGKIGRMNIARKKYNTAINYFKEAADTELDSNKKAKYYLELADAYRLSGSFNQGRSMIYKALELKPDFGEAYLILGNIYISGAKSCGNSFENSAVYWIAVDSFKKALRDEQTKEKAGKSINTYSKYFPSQKTCFENSPPYNTKNGLPATNVISNGDIFNIGCWINKSTIVRVSESN